MLALALASLPLASLVTGAPESDCIEVIIQDVPAGFDTYLRYHSFDDAVRGAIRFERRPKAAPWREERIKVCGLTGRRLLAWAWVDHAGNETERCKDLHHETCAPDLEDPTRARASGGRRCHEAPAGRTCFVETGGGGQLRLRLPSRRLVDRPYGPSSLPG